MVILDYPYISEGMCARLAARRFPVLRNPAAEACLEKHDLNLLNENEFVDSLRGGARLYVNNENALSWVLRNDPVGERVRGIKVMKDKHAFRQALRPMYPDYHFARHTFDELRDIDPAGLRFPLVLKPSVGFFSIGVFVVNDAAEWRRARQTLEEKWHAWKNSYPEGVLGELYFSTEEYIRGDEFAVDAYYDDHGRAVVLNVMKHEFADESDVRDRLYCLYPDRMKQWAGRFADYLNEAGALLKLRGFPFHAEVRVAGDIEGGTIVPIEFNPLRFAGCCSTDIAQHAFGVNTWMSFLDDRTPDWDAIPADRLDNRYSMVMLDKPASYVNGMTFDYDALKNHLTEVIEVREFAPDSSAFGYAFARTPKANMKELDAILRSDLTEFLRPA